ncbi:MAG: hypothetical protein NC453_26315 [Muribaculum sp.]|nr:hypothetical protein [Muribaculum sp.]
MTVKELMAELAKYPEDMEVWKMWDDSEHGSHDGDVVSEVYMDDCVLIIE